ncbi:MAG: maltokinase N-terminal cap-like domain-containing protein, partial [Vicinamibacterales bacterium]
MTGSPELVQRASRWLFDQLPAAAPLWLAGQRWFGGKTRTIERVDVGDVVWLSRDPACALVILDIRYAIAGTVPAGDRYATLIALDDHPSGASTIGCMEGSLPVFISERSTAPACLLALVQVLRGDEAIRGSHGAIVCGDATDELKRLLSRDPASAPSVVAIGAEQSNTSVRLGSAHVVKLLRRLDDGENPQLEIGRFLSRGNFGDTPRLEGSLTYRGTDGRSATLGIVEAWL